MKKIIIFTLLAILLYAIAAYLFTQHQDETIAKYGNPYQKENLDPSTVGLLKDPEYQYNITPKDLEKKIEKGEDVYVYFYSPTCPFCKKATPIVNDVLKANGLEPIQYNLLEFNDGWEKYGILGTPTLIHFSKGKEVSRITGAKTKEIFDHWVKENKKK